MTSLPSSIRVFVTRRPVDLRKAFDGLCAMTRNTLRLNPFTGHLFVFLLVKIRGGLAVTLSGCCRRILS